MRRRHARSEHRKRHDRRAGRLWRSSFAAVAGGLVISLAAAPAGALPIDPGLPIDPSLPSLPGAPLPGQPTPGPGLPEVPIPPLPGPTEPTTTITEKDVDETEGTASFGFESDQEGATFECRITGPEETTAWQACQSPKVYTELADGDHVFEVRAVSDGLKDATPEQHAWTVERPAVPLDTRITRGPRDGAWVLGRSVAFRYRSTVADSRFACGWNGRSLPCGAASARIGRLTAGTHTFTVAALARRTRDLTPATRSFSVPFDDRALKATGRWAKKRKAGHLANTYLQSRQRGATLSGRVKDARKLALVADKGRGHGIVKVYLGKRVLKTVRLAAPKNRTRRVIPIASFKRPRAGLVRVVVSSKGKPVRIDGLGVHSG